MNKMMKKATAIGVSALAAVTAFSGMTFAAANKEEAEVPAFVTETMNDVNDEQELLDMLSGLGIDVDESCINNEDEMPEGVEFTEKGECVLDSGFTLESALELISILNNPERRTEAAEQLIDGSGIVLTDEEKAEMLTMVHDLTLSDVRSGVVDMVTDPEFYKTLKNVAIDTAAEILEEKCNEAGQMLISLTAEDIKGFIESFSFV